jgi:dTDP-4-amino-4,6-dideoxygalactose transaminase
MPVKPSQPIYVTRPSLPPLEEYVELLRGVWQRGILTHHGPLVQQLEAELIRCLRVSNLIAVVNGTVAIEFALRVFDLDGEIITTPFTWIATASAVTWQRCQPVFVDVRPDTFNIDPERIEAAITSRTRAILGVHVFGNPCDIEAIDAIARRHSLRVIYDAAHAMFVNYHGRSVLEYGDVSATSFHATKIFQTGEGGACVTRDAAVAQRLRRLRFFGHDENKEIVDIGTNGKMTEIHAAMGLALLPHMGSVLANRRRKYALYQQLLSDCPFISFQKFQPDAYNYSYLPVLFRDEAQVLAMEERLKKNNIVPRRYFYPSLSTVKTLGQRGSFPVAEDLARRVLCLPLFDTLPEEQVEFICSVIKS